MTTFYIPTAADGKIDAPGAPQTKIDLDVTTTLSMPHVNGRAGREGFMAWQTVAGTTPRSMLHSACGTGARIFTVTGTPAMETQLDRGDVDGWDLVGAWDLTVTGELNTTLVAAWCAAVIPKLVALPIMDGVGLWVARGQAEWDALT